MSNDETRARRIANYIAIATDSGHTVIDVTWLADAFIAARARVAELEQQCQRVEAACVSAAGAAAGLLTRAERAEARVAELEEAGRTLVAANTRHFDEALRLADRVAELESQAAELTEMCVATGKARLEAERQRNSVVKALYIAHALLENKGASAESNARAALAEINAVMADIEKGNHVEAQR